MYRRPPLAPATARRFASVFAFVVPLLLGATARDARAGDWAVNVGAIEAIGVPGATHLGLYPYLGLSFSKPLGRVTLIPGLSVEAAPESGRWGLVGSLVADFSVTRHLGLDVQVVLITDQPGLDFAAIELLVGAGAGLSLFLGDWVVSPFVNFFRDVVIPGWVLVPGINLAHAI